MSCFYDRCPSGALAVFTEVHIQKDSFADDCIELVLPVKSMQTIRGVSFACTIEDHCRSCLGASACINN